MAVKPEDQVKIIRSIGSVTLGYLVFALSAVAVILAIGAAVSLVSTIGHGAIWSQVAELVLMAPSATLGGWTNAKRA